MSTKLRVALAILTVINVCQCANILMITMGGTKSHKIPYWELARGLIPRGHNITFISPFPADFFMPGLEEITPAGLVFYVRNFTNWDLVGARMRGEEPVHPLDVIRYPSEACDEMYSDPEMKDYLFSKPDVDLIIMDGAFPECSLGLAHHFKKPFIYINTVAFYTFSLSMAGNPVLYSVTPFLAQPLTDKMNVFQRTWNTLWYVGIESIHTYTINYMVQNVLYKHFGKSISTIQDMTKNVSFILQNGHVTMTYPRPYLPNVAEIACIHCKPAKALPYNLEKFINGSGDAGFIYVSMGSSVRAANMPEYLRRMLIYVFRQLPQRVLWKWEADDDMHDLSDNVMLGRWLPQQDILGHPKIKAFVTHGGLLSMFETVYHGVPIVTMPVFCDHDSNAAKAEVDGYALKLELSTLTAESLLWSIKKVIHDGKYKQEVKRMQYLLKDQKESPLDRAIYWTEYVIRHRGAPHLQSTAKDLNFVQYFLLDVIAIIVLSLCISWFIMKWCLKFIYRLLMGNVNFYMFRKSIKID
ncbi:PREDICTED: 2-hydroxyacylsphingosine 1-beta-galactosyltransferase-like [Nicrophorus vespilloides]|uniref:UDP-glucuronosyltransferase n=1 Tax=Nicrophorus vespilloides TaxID=110193 RepID=A0ABM1MM85_NICVS|nr:PREDICTED: 2-hydroxyacylsphingosine 1-beta-galactosyltransferase-like [Nicrophorus vespilloides]XP_017775685.1 PREDICTED: 2-hydroxyacylsphingosine 1-beta-galactosyltransferase-like [Nicrophorus vespilloides]